MIQHGEGVGHDWTLISVSADIMELHKWSDPAFRSKCVKTKNLSHQKWWNKWCKHPNPVFSCTVSIPSHAPLLKCYSIYMYNTRVLLSQPWWRWASQEQSKKICIYFTNIINWSFFSSHTLCIRYYCKIFYINIFETADFVPLFQKSRAFNYLLGIRYCLSY